MNFRENWRILLLAVFVILATVALFAPQDGGGPGPDSVETASGITNLKYGLDLSGGLRIRGTLSGLTAEDVEVTQDNTDTVKRTVRQELGLDPIDVEVRPAQREDGTGTVEIFSENVTAQAFADALNQAGLSASTDQIRRGVTRATRSNAADVIDRKINRGGIGGGGASVVNTATGQHFIVVETPNVNRTAVLDAVTRTGRVQVVAEYPVDTENGTEYRTTALLTQGDFAGIGQARQGQQGRPPNVPVTLRDTVAPNYSEAMQKFGFLGEGVGSCRYAENRTEDPGWCLHTVVDGEVSESFSMGDRLAQDMRQGTWVNDPSFILQTSSFGEAQQVKLDLETGALPTELQIDTYNKVLPSLAQKFKPLALVTGLVAWLTVAGVIFFRYRQIEVAVPMLLTAVAEVYILLGFAATVGLALDLSHIAGFIAVIGTGVDDLVIIADEILQQGEVATGRVFQSRFRKAFWVIGAAAATTIIAMAPLTVLGLGDLSGFAIVTIVGVLIGVIITRPAYGDILRHLVLSRQKD